MMFSEGHTMEEINDLCYWHVKGYADFQAERNENSKDGPHGKQLKPSQQKMIEERKEQEKREKEMRKK